MTLPLNPNALKSVSAFLGGAFFIYVGVLHFIDTSWFEPIVPPIFRFPTFWVLISGVAEIAVGIALLTPSTRKTAGYASALLLIAVYPANLYMWVYNVELGDGSSLTPTGHVVRLLLQVAGIMVSLWIAGWSFKTQEKSL